MSSDGGCCSLECGAKIVAWLQVIGGGISVLVCVILFIVISFKEETPHHKDLGVNATAIPGLESLSKEEEEAAYNIAVFVIVLVALFYIVMFVLSFLLLIGIYKDRLSYITGWLIAKSVLLALTAASIFLRIFALLLGLDSDLTYTILWTVVDILQVWVVYCYREEKKSQVVVYS